MPGDLIGRAEHEIHRPFTRQYVLALCSMAAILLTAHILLVLSIRADITGAAEVNQSGRQRSLMARIAGNALVLATTPVAVDPTSARARMQHEVAELRAAEQRLHPDGAGSARQLQVEAYAAMAEALLEVPAAEVHVDHPLVTAIVTSARAEGPADLPPLLEADVATFEQQLRDVSGRITVQSRVLTVTGLLFILAVGLALFRPMARHLRHFVDEEYRNQSRLRAVVGNPQLKSLVIDEGGVIQWANASCAELGLADPAALAGKCLWSLAPDPSESRALREAVSSTVADSSNQTLHAVLSRADGTTFSCQVGIAAVEDPLGHERTQLLVLLTDVSSQRAMEAELRHRATHDELTGLANRSLLVDAIDELLAVPAADRPPTTLLYLDLDDFKQINDTMGHSVGDEFLVHISQRLVASARPDDLCVRVGGDEFAILLEGLAADRAEQFATVVLAEVGRPVLLRGRLHRATCSIGLHTLAGTVDTAETVLRDADAAMYASKDAGKGGHAVFESSMHDDLMGRVQLRTDIERTVAGDQLVVEYQPVRSLRDGRLTGAEALVRWDHPTRGRLMPDQFIAVAEETGAIVPLGRWVLREASTQASAWRRAGLVDDDFTISVNVSPVQIDDADFLDLVDDVLDRAGLPPGALVLELTESVLICDTEAVNDLLSDLRALGVSIAIDDFGTGFSSLAYLQRLPVDILKVDRSFVESLRDESAASRLVTQGIVELARRLGLRTVAEGVEHAEEEAILAELQCDQAQGHLWSPAVPADELTRMIRLSHPHAVVGAP